MVVHALVLRREPAQQQVIDTRRLLGEWHLGAHLERGRAATPEVALESDMPDHPFGAHRYGRCQTAAGSKLLCRLARCIP
jgi:hypothetical protein